uniref:Histidine--tRNA ligase, chloroplastic n=1 Tax=Caloglossa intermedia TaxID=100879 RepID=A0A1Z1M6I5_9FLOR|nr:Histidine-tRNA ligase [Caloglossa intermedia]ARW61550.1 Histidine-tRNA ligase [Caloglossa intermedia]
MQSLRGTKDILPEEITSWQDIYYKVQQLFNKYNYNEIRTPIFEYTDLFFRSIGSDTDIINREMYSFKDKGERNITLRPEGTASIARAYITNKMHKHCKVNRLWYLGPMFRYERPQKGRQRQFHQLGIECIGSSSPLADTEIIRIADKILQTFYLDHYSIEINSLGNLEERAMYREKLKEYLNPYEKDLDEDSKKRLVNNPLRILDSKNLQVKEILSSAPRLTTFLKSKSMNHFYKVCEHLAYLNIPYVINEKLVRGLDYYNYTAFEIKTDQLGAQETICGGGRYDKLIEQLGGPATPSVGWAIGIERLLMLVKDKPYCSSKQLNIYIIAQGAESQKQAWNIIKIIEECNINFHLDLTEYSLTKKLGQANLLNAQVCFIIAEEEIKNNYITAKWLKNSSQQRIEFPYLKAYINAHKYLLNKKVAQ